MNWHLFSGFLLITIVLLLTPGPIVTLVISTGATKGVRAALTTVAGTSIGNALLIAAIALGLNWVLSHALYLFELLRWAGVAYLVWLGVRAWRRAAAPQQVPTPRHVHFRQGLLVALSNPKTIAFFSAFLPQFVDPTLPAARQLAVMCTVTVLLAAASDSCWAIAAGLGRAWFMRPQRARVLARASALTLIGGGIWLSLARRPA
ncbi:MAG TPA: LysE family translocator [Steroidobacteraceae bacterium]|nr:LysE family translocator [Steroidobacteraceae bacterium]